MGHSLRLLRASLAVGHGGGVLLLACRSHDHIAILVLLAVSVLHRLRGLVLLGRRQELTSHCLCGNRRLCSCSHRRDQWRGDVRVLRDTGGTWLHVLVAFGENEAINLLNDWMVLSEVRGRVELLGLKSAQTFISTP